MQQCAMYQSDGVWERINLFSKLLYFNCGSVSKIQHIFIHTKIHMSVQRCWVYGYYWHLSTKLTHQQYINMLAHIPNIETYKIMTYNK